METNITREQIAALKSGQEIDDLVAIHVLKYLLPGNHTTTKHSHDVSAAWPVWEWLTENNRYPTLHNGPTEYSEETVYFMGLVNPACDFDCEETAPLAICRAALYVAVSHV